MTRQPLTGLRRACLMLGLSILFMIPPGLIADQNDARLPQLFSDLGNAPNAHSARAVEQKIWAIWFESRDPAGRELLDEARSSAEAGDARGAIALFDRLVTEHPDYAEGWNQRAIMRYLLGDVAGSLQDIERVIELEPRHFGALSGRGQCFLQQERYQEALGAFEDALSVNPWIESAARQIEMLRTYIQDRNTPI